MEGDSVPISREGNETRRRVVSASAPGKVILFGEHSVVYGKRCIAAAIDLRTEVVVSGGIASDAGLSPQQCGLCVKALGETVTTASLDCTVWEKESRQRQTPVTDAVAVILEVLHGVFEKEEKKAEVMSMLGVLDVTVNSDLPAMRGLGSSASFSVAVSACLLAYFDILPSRNSTTLDSDDLARINSTALTAERRLHGNPSGIDNFVVTYGGFVTKLGATMERLFIGADDLALLVIDTNVPRSTSKLVANVRDRLNKHPNATQQLLDSAGSIAEEACQVLTTDDNSKVEQLETLMEMNQGVLEALGVGHAKVSEVVQICRMSGCRGVKITGAGGGGCLIALIEAKHSAQLRTDLQARGFECFSARMNCPGVQLSIQSR